MGVVHDEYGENNEQEMRIDDMSSSGIINIMDGRIDNQTDKKDV